MSQDGVYDTRGRAELESRQQVAREQLDELREKMDAIRQEVAEDVDRNWTSMWRTTQMFDLKVTTRLASHEEYRSLLGQTRDIEAVEATLTEELDRIGEDGSASG